MQSVTKLTKRDRTKSLAMSLLNMELSLSAYGCTQGVVEAPKEPAEGEEAPEEFTAEKLEAALKVSSRVCVHVRMCVRT